MKIKSLYSLYLFCLIGLCFSCQDEVTEEEIVEKTNFIIFIADDVSWDDLGAYGNTEVYTPNIDRIAQEGMIFHNTFLTASSCSPSRISIMTGRYPHNTGAAELHTEPSQALPSMASMLQAGGYYTAAAGKWHMGNLLQSGFDTIHVKNNGLGGEDKWVETLVNRDPDKPFFFWFAAVDAHRGWGENEFNGQHHPDSLTVPPTLFDDDSTKYDLAQYYDEITRFDHYIGLVEQQLASEGILDETMIVIMADNGRPFPRDKTRVYDSGMKTPFIVKWPKGIPTPGQATYSMVSSIDIAPTIAEILGQDPPNSFQGESFLPLLLDPSTSTRPHIFAEHNWHDFEAYERMVRTPDYLYLINRRPHLPNQGPADAIRSLSFKSLLQNKDQLNPIQYDIFQQPRASEELFLVEDDPLQIRNLAEHPDFQNVKDSLHQILIDWQTATLDTEPMELTKDWYDRTTGLKLDIGHGIRGEMPGTELNAIEWLRQ